MVGMRFSYSAAIAGLLSVASAQTFQRLGGCPTFGCVFPPDQVDFMGGQYFDIRLEVHAPVNGSEAGNSTGKPDTGFTFTVGKVGEAAQPAAQFFGVAEPKLESWNVSCFESTNSPVNLTCTC